MLVSLEGSCLIPTPECVLSEQWAFVVRITALHWQTSDNSNSWRTCRQLLLSVYNVVRVMHSQAQASRVEGGGANDSLLP